MRGPIVKRAKSRFAVFVALLLIASQCILACTGYRDPKELAAFYRPINYPRMTVA
jgi:hypothetical protein